jgi:hypothetical protein
MKITFYEKVETAILTETSLLPSFGPFVTTLTTVTAR